MACFNSWLMLSILVSISVLATFVSATASIKGGLLKCKVEVEAEAEEAAASASASAAALGECYDEWSMDSDVSRRRLVIGIKPQSYITYPALGRQACTNQAGMPYTQGNGCLSPAVNPYNRNCLKLYQCRS